MNEPNNNSAQQIDENRVADASPINPNLGVAVGEDCDALQDDLRQAKEVAGGLNAELAGKSKQLQHLNFLIEQTKAHLGHLQDGIVAMRKERHKLANTAVRVPLMDTMLSKVTSERDQLRNELNRILDGLAIEDAQRAQRALRFDKRDQQIAELTFELISLRQEVADLRRLNPRPAPVASEPPPRPCPLKTSAKEDTWAESGMEIVPTERVGGSRARA